MRGTLLYIGQRLILIAITTVLVSSIVFLLLHQIPGNAFLNETRQSPQTLAAELHHYGLDLPLQQQYVNWVQNVVHGDLASRSSTEASRSLRCSSGRRRSARRLASSPCS